MWWKFLLLTLYLVVLILLSRILEIFTYYQTGCLANGLINPLSLTVQRLRAILENRGVSHRNVLEKRDLTDLISNSGEVTQRELEGVTRSEGQSELEDFECEAHFLEKVEDTKDSVWVIQVVREGGMGGGGMDLKAWSKVAKRLSKFGIQCGVFRCANDEKFCKRKGWHNNQIILSTPEGRCVKDQVVMRSLGGTLSKQNEGRLVDWVAGELSERLEKIRDFETFEQQWLKFDPTYPHQKSSSHDSHHQSPNHHSPVSSYKYMQHQNEKLPESFESWEQGCQEKIRALFISNLTTAPLFFSVMAAKFSGRVKLGVINAKDHNFRNFISKHPFKHNPPTNHPSKSPSSPPKYFIITPNRLKSFGLRPGEHFNYRSFFGLLRSLHPESNDVFILSIIISTILCSFNLFQPSLSIHHHLLSIFITTTKTIFLLLITWLATTNLPIPLFFTDLPLSFLRFICLSDLASLLREDLSFYFSSTQGKIIIVTTFTIIISLYSRLTHKTPNHTENTATHPVTSSVTTTCMHLIENIMEGICRGLFNNTTTTPHTLPDHDDHYNMIIQRLAVPDLWLRPLISPQYLHDLPLWRYDGVEGDECEGAWDEGERGFKEGCERCRVVGRGFKEAAMMLLDGDYTCKCGDREDGEEEDDDGAAATSHICSNLQPPHHNHHHNDNHTTQCPHHHKQQSPQGTTEAPRGIIASSECAICLDLYTGGDLLCGLPCCHAYHQRCIMGWLSRDNHCCPICRWPSYKAKPPLKHVTQDHVRSDHVEQD